jgi:hypothetical protein
LRSGALRRPCFPTTPSVHLVSERTGQPLISASRCAPHLQGAYKSRAIYARDLESFLRGSHRNALRLLTCVPFETMEVLADKLGLRDCSGLLTSGDSHAASSWDRAQAERGPGSATSTYVMTKHKDQCQVCPSGMPLGKRNLVRRRHWTELRRSIPTDEPGSYPFARCGSALL